MTLATDIRRSVTDTTPVYALVGVTDLAVQKVREVQTRATRARADLELRSLQAKAQQTPTVAVTLTLEAAGRAEETYDDLALRGKRLVDRIKKQRATQDLLAQGKVTLSRGKAAVTTVRRGGADTKAATKATLTTAKREGAELAADTRQNAANKTVGTKSATKRTTTTAKKRASTTKRSTKAASTSARKTAAGAAATTQAAAGKVGR